MAGKGIVIDGVSVGGEAAIEAMDQYSYTEVGRKTLNFVRRCMRDPVLREKIQRRAAELRLEAEAKAMEGGMV